MSFLERGREKGEKGLMAAPESLLAQGWLATLTGFSLALKVLNSFHGLRHERI